MSSHGISQVQKNCHVSGCGANSSLVVVYSAKRSKDKDSLEKYERWFSILDLADMNPSVIYACQRHFPAGAPTRNNPDPNPRLFNPIPEISSHCVMPCDAVTVSAIGHPPEGRILEIDGKHLPSAIYPPPGSILKLAPNATLIDLKKIKEKQGLSKPIRIEEVTVMIDEKDTVKVVDYGPREPIYKCFDSKLRRDWKSKRRSLYSSIWDDGRNDEYGSLSSEPNFQDFHDHSLGVALERMRQLRLDCNTAIVDIYKRKMVYAHRAVLVARSPYFYRQLYLKRKKNRCLYEFGRFTLPFDIDFDIVEAVISYIYTGSLSILLRKKPSLVRELLTLFEMKESLEIYNQELSSRESENMKTKHLIKEEPMEEESVIVLPYDGDDNVTPVIDVDERPDHERKRRKRTLIDVEPVEDVRGKLKVSVHKIVENALNPFLGNIEELFDPSSSTFQIAKTSQHIITLWHTDILLTKLFDQNELTKFFSQVMNDIFDKSIQLKHASARSDSGAYTFETLYTQSECTAIDDPYTKPYIGGAIDHSIDQPTQTLTLDDMQIITYNQLPSKNIPMYSHMISMYRFNIFMKKKITKVDANVNGKDLIPSLLERNVLAEDSPNTPSDIEDIVNRIAEEQNLLNNFMEPVSETCFQLVTVELRNRVVADLELYVNPSFHEELIMHIIVDQIDQMDAKNVLPLSIGIFLAKGCNFCRKKECKSEDLTMPISPDNPVCPDRQCIKRNLQCDICNKQMSNSKSLSRHKYGVHDIEVGDTTGHFICSHCGESFSKKWKLNIHEREHEDRKIELICSYCKKKIRGSIALKKHITMVHKAKPQFPCDLCPKIFKRRETLSVHRRIHTGDKPYRCYYCEYASETKGNLKAHIIRKHKLQLVSYDPQESQAHVIPAEQPHSESIDDQTHMITEEDTEAATAEDKVMAATIVAHSLTGGSFIITSETPPTSIVR